MFLRKIATLVERILRKSAENLVPDRKFQFEFQGTGATMDDEMLPAVAANRAWTSYLAVHDDVDPLDARRCTLERYLRQRWQAGECDTEELTCLGLAYLARVPSDSW